MNPPQIHIAGDALRLPFIVLLLAIAAYAQSMPCPPGCECLSESEFLAKFSHASSSEDLCGTAPNSSGPLPCPHPRACFKSVPAPPGFATVSPGPNTPGNHAWQAGTDDPRNVMLQLMITTGAVEGAELKGLVLQAFGSGNDSAGVSRVEVYYDVDGDGSVGAGELLLGSVEPAYAGDDGECAVRFGLGLAAGSTRHILVAYVMSHAAQAGDTYGFTVKDMRMEGTASNATFWLDGLPINSSVKTVVAQSQPVIVRPGCSGSITISLNQSVVAPGSPVLATAAGLSDCGGRTVSVLQGGCNSTRIPSCSCTVSDSSCQCAFPAPSQPGTYDYYACIGIRQDGLRDESAPARLTVEVQQNPSRCVSDGDCTGDSSCSGGACTVIVAGVCGHASNHTWSVYACGPEPGCPQCAGSASCENHTCVANPAQGNGTTTNGTSNFTTQHPARPGPQEGAAPGIIPYLIERPLILAGALIVIGLGLLGYWIYRKRPPAS